jgi:hypothetical protein
VVGWPYVFVASIGVVAVIDVSDAAHPRFVNSYTYEIGGSSPRMKVDHHTGYLLDNTGLRVLDLSRPVLPREIGFLALPEARPDAFSVLDEAVYVGGPGGNTWIVDASDPADPVIAGQIRDLATNLLIDEPFGSAYAASEAGIRIFVLGDPLRPQEAGSYLGDLGDGHSLIPVAVEADRLYAVRNVGEAGATVQVLQLTEPTELRPLGEKHPLDSRSALVARAALLYVGFPGGLQILDFADPGAPRALGRFDAAG